MFQRRYSFKNYGKKCRQRGQTWRNWLRTVDRSDCMWKKQHVGNFKKLIARTDKIVEASQMKATRQNMPNLFYFGRSKGEVRSRLVNDIPKPWRKWLCIWCSYGYVQARDFIQSYLLHHMTTYYVMWFSPIVCKENVDDVSMHSPVTPCNHIGGVI